MADEQKPIPERKVAKLDLGGFKPKAMPTVTPAVEREAIVAARQHGFSARSEAVVLDGRRARKKGKMQMNMRVSLDTRRDLLGIIAEFPDADSALSHLIKLYQEKSRI
jgi:hypothetical protein